MTVIIHSRAGDIVKIRPDRLYDMPRSCYWCDYSPLHDLRSHATIVTCPSHTLFSTFRFRRIPGSHYLFTQNPKVMAAFSEMMSGGAPDMAKMQELMSDPEVGPVLQKLVTKLGGGAMGGGGMPGGGFGGAGGGMDDIPDMGGDDDDDEDFDDLPDLE